MLNRTNFSRRKFLKANGAAVALPFLHSMPGVFGAGSKVAKPSKKLAIMYIPNGIVRRCFFPGEEQGELPGFVGGFNADQTKNQKRKQNAPGIYPLELTPTMQPLKDHTKDVTLDHRPGPYIQERTGCACAGGVVLPYEFVAGTGGRAGR